jgi:hypothetical protein
VSATVAVRLISGISARRESCSFALALHETLNDLSLELNPAQWAGWQIYRADTQE